MFADMFAELRTHGLTLKNIRRVLCNTGGARHEALRACAFLLAPQLTPLVGSDFDGVRYVLSTAESTGVCFPTFVRGFFDEETVHNMLVALAQHACISTIRGSTVLEVGANIGTETVSLLVRHGVAHVVAIEPDSQNVRFLRANLALNGVQDRVAIHEMALSDTDGKVVLECSECNWGDHRVRVADPLEPGLQNEGQRHTHEVPARRLDSLLDTGEIDLAAIDLVWMDAQGHEGHILAGAQRLANANIPIVTEYWPYGLSRVGALDRFHDLVADRHETVIDLREPACAIAAERIADLAPLTMARGDDPRIPYTDLLLL